LNPLLAFVLTPTATMPDAEGLPATLLKWGVEAKGWAAKDGSVEIENGKLFFAFMPSAIPNGEAEAVAAYSVGALGVENSEPDQRAKLGAHAGHVVVSFVPAKDHQRTLEDMVRFTRAVAAITEWSSAVGVYWGAGSVAHAARFFLLTVENLAVPLPAWTGVSVAEGSGRVRFLSTGMSQFSLPELMVTAPAAHGRASLAYFFELLSHVVKRGEAFASGDTVGRSERESVPVIYEPSPLQKGERIAVVHLAQ